MRSARVGRGWSQEVLADRLAEAGINVGGQSGVARIERGARPTRFNEVVSIARFLEIDLNDLGADVSPSAVASVAVEIRRLKAEVEELTTALQSADAAAESAANHAMQIRKRHAMASTRMKSLEGLFAQAATAQADLLNSINEGNENDGDR